ncbi:hypothetical protein ONB67_00010 [Candidatus Vidania fulgoroideae]|uniref:indole-3-glycerol-phosphate synthase n=1 Tax=Candidatus Vidania fulgoroideorum TaxID=881286 RepID=A0AAX3NBA9_9PROT|nr:hypothetical protein ONB67_00010 [Candidatus Vidania fulgoroideae]
MLNFLKKIVENKLLELKKRKKKIKKSVIKNIYYRYVKKKTFYGFSKIIGEIKFFTPIIGKISLTRNINKFVKIYKNLNIKTFSILTEKVFFSGNYSYIPIIKSKKNNKKVKILRKDFIIDKYQIYESIIIGSDIILIIVYLLKIKIIKDIIKFNINFLLEIFSKKDIRKINFVNNKKKFTIGINSRNLKNSNFKSKEDILKISKFIKNKNIILESGIKKIKEIIFFKKINFGLLIGEFFIKKIINENIYRNK